MINKYIRDIMVLSIIFILIGCGHKSHEYNHNHEQHHKEEHTNISSHPQGISIPAELAHQAGIKTSILKPTSFHRIIKTSGLIEPTQSDETFVVARVSGIVKFCTTIIEGISVDKDLNLISISSKQMADADPSERARITYETAKSEYERALVLAESKIVSNKELNKIKETYEQARLTYEAIAKGSQNDGVMIKSPIKGYISDILVKEGEYVSVGQPLLKINRYTRLYLKAEVSERHYGALEKVVGANFKVLNNEKVYATSELNGRILSYGRKIGNDSHYLPFFIEFDNTDNLLIGSFAEIFLLTEIKPNVLTLPYTALTEEQGVFFAYVKVDESCYEKREIRLGENNGREVEILSGLNEGDEVVYHGVYHVRLASVSKSIPGHSHEH